MRGTVRKSESDAEWIGQVQQDWLGVNETWVPRGKAAKSRQRRILCRPRRSRCSRHQMTATNRRAEQRRRPRLFEKCAPTRSCLLSLGRYATRGRRAQCRAAPCCAAPRLYTKHIQIMEAGTRQATYLKSGIRTLQFTSRGEGATVRLACAALGCAALPYWVGGCCRARVRVVPVRDLANCALSADGVRISKPISRLQPQRTAAVRSGDDVTGWAIQGPGCSNSMQTVGEGQQDATTWAL